MWRRVKSCNALFLFENFDTNSALQKQAACGGQEEESNNSLEQRAEINGDGRFALSLEESLFLRKRHADAGRGLRILEVQSSKTLGDAGQDGVLLKELLCLTRGQRFRKKGRGRALFGRSPGSALGGIYRRNCGGIMPAH